MARREAALGILLAAWCLPGRADDRLAHITTHTLQELARLPDCTCLETLLREHKAAGASGPMRPLDTVRLEILYSAGRELYASPGDLRWEQSPAAFPAAGLIGNGPFALYLRAIFATGDAVFTDRGADRVDGRAAVRYDFQIPQIVSGHTMKVVGGEGTVGMKGSFWADPVSLDLLRLEVDADEIPAGLPVVYFRASVRYSRVRIGGRDVILPQSGEMHLLEESGEENRDLLEFTHCRSFQVESTLSFEKVPPIIANPPPPAFSTSAVGHPNTEGTLPAGLEVTVALTAPVSEESAVGAGVEGRVTHDVLSQGQVLVARGAPVHGRIRRLDLFTDRSGDYFVVALEFIEIESRGVLLRFFADLANVHSLPGFEWQWTTSHTSSIFRGRQRVVTTERSTLPNLPGVGAFFVRGPRFTLPAGVDLFWRTRALVR